MPAILVAQEHDSGRPPALASLGRRPLASLGRRPLASLGRRPLASLGGRPLSSLGGRPLASLGRLPLARVGGLQDVGSPVALVGATAPAAPAARPSSRPRPAPVEARLLDVAGDAERREARRAVRAAGWRAFHAGDWTLARQLLLAESGDDGHGHATGVVAAFGLGRFEEAARRIRQAGAASVDVTALLAGSFAVRADALDRHLHRHPGDAGAWLVDSWLRLQLGDDDGAAHALQVVCQLDPQERAVRLLERELVARLQDGS